MLKTKPNIPLVVMLMTPGFDRTDFMAIAAELRKRGFAVWHMALTRTPIRAVDNLEYQADLALSQYLQRYHTISNQPRPPIRYLITPQTELPLKYISIDARIPKLFEEIQSQNGQIVLGPNGLFLTSFANLWDEKYPPPHERDPYPIILRSFDMTIPELADLLVDGVPELKHPAPVL